MDYERELQVVYEIKYGSDDFESDSVRSPFGDDMAYTNLTLLEPTINATSSVVSDSDSSSESNTFVSIVTSP